MEINNIKIGTKFELEIITSKGDKIGQTYISQLIDVIDEKNILIAAPIHESRLMLINVNTKIRIILLHEGIGLLSFTGTIASKEKNGNITILGVRIESEMEKIQRRKHYRLDCTLDASYRHIMYDDTGHIIKSGSEESEYKKAITKNVSGSGISIVTDEDVPKNSYLEVILHIGNKAPITIDCKVMRNTKIDTSKEKKYDLGLYFMRILPKDQEALVKYIFDQQKLMLKKGKLFDKK